MMSSTRMLLSILKPATPHEILNELMLARGLKQKNYGYFGSKGVASKVINGIKKHQSDLAFERNYG